MASSQANVPDGIESTIKRLQTFQMAQTSELSELRKSLNYNVMELGKQISELANVITNKQTVPISKNSGETSSAQMEIGIDPNDSVALVDPEMLAYAVSMYGNADCTPSKHIKFDMPKFNGSDPEAWIFMARRFFIFHNTPEDQKLIIASFHVTDAALKWFLWMESSNYLTTWPAFVKSLLKKFNPTTYTIPGGRLSKISQITSVVEFVTRLEDYSSKVIGVPDWFLLEMFISGLKDEVQTEVVKASSLTFRKPWS